MLSPGVGWTLPRSLRLLWGANQTVPALLSTDVCFNAAYPPLAQAYGACQASAPAGGTLLSSTHAAIGSSISALLDNRREKYG